MHFHFSTNRIDTLSDTHTPVALYLKLRDKYPHSFLLESSDYKSRENSFSYLCLQPIASFVAGREHTELCYPDGSRRVMATADCCMASDLQAFACSFSADKQDKEFLSNGLFGYTSYDAIPLFTDIRFRHQSFDLPLLQYHVFRFVIVFNHFNNELYLLEHLLPGEPSELQLLADTIANRTINYYGFTTLEPETSNLSDAEFLEKITAAQRHCFRGDVFQVVLSRKFSQPFQGDEFNVYRALRSVNPSPYLFYFDYGAFTIFGSSPEAQLTIAGGKASIHPIAGTFRRTGDALQDRALAEALLSDPKENAEHIMLVDLARNDLSKHCHEIAVERLRDIEYYSHVIHLVSKVSGLLPSDYNPFELLADTYPAGTLSGAPKHRAMQIIDEQEPAGRGFYGGAVGYIGFEGSFNHAIFIRSFVSRNNTLSYQAGCGIVTRSQPESELQEVNNKVSALRKAIALAATI